MLGAGSPVYGKIAQNKFSVLVLDNGFLCLVHAIYHIHKSF